MNPSKKFNKFYLQISHNLKFHIAFPSQKLCQLPIRLWSNTYILMVVRPKDDESNMFFIEKCKKRS